MKPTLIEIYATPSCVLYLYNMHIYSDRYTFERVNIVTFRWCMIQTVEIVYNIIIYVTGWTNTENSRENILVFFLFLFFAIVKRTIYNIPCTFCCSCLTIKAKYKNRLSYGYGHTRRVIIKSIEFVYPFALSMYYVRWRVDFTRNEKNLFSTAEKKGQINVSAIFFV